MIKNLNKAEEFEMGLLIDAVKEAINLLPEERHSNFLLWAGAAITAKAVAIEKPKGQEIDILLSEQKALIKASAVLITPALIAIHAIDEM